MTSTQVLSSSDSMVYSHAIGICTMRGRGFYCPVDTVIDPSGRILVLNRSIDRDIEGIRVTVCGPNSEFYMVFGHGGTGNGEFIWPSSITCDRSGNSYIADQYLNRISIFDPEGKFISNWGTEGSLPGQFNGPSGLAMDPDDNLLVVDHLNNRIQKYTARGEYMSQFGSSGPAEGELDMPWGIDVNYKGEIFIADWRNDRIQVFSTNGDFIAKFGESGQENGQLNRPSSVTVDTQGLIYIADWGNERIQILDKEGNFVTKLRGDAGLSKWADEFMTANVDEATARENSEMEPNLPHLKNDPHEESSHIEKLFWGPVSVNIDSARRLYVTESNRHRIQVYDWSR